MIDFFEKTKGSISLFLALIMLPMMTVAGLIVDGARISAAKASLSGAGDLAMNAALSEYDQILYDVYGIFAVSENMEELQNNVSRYHRAGSDGGHSHRRLDGLRRAHRKDGDPAGVGHGGVLRGCQGPLRRGKGRGAV